MSITPVVVDAGNRSSWRLLVTMGCGDECPFVPGLKREDWPFPDPKDQSIEQTRQIRDDIERRIKAFIQAEDL